MKTVNKLSELIVSKIPHPLRNLKNLLFILLILAMPVTLILVQNSQDLRQYASDNTIETTTEYGFNTHFTTSGAYDYTNLTPEFFNITVDDLVANQQKWIRFNVLAGEISSAAPSSNDYVWNNENLQKYDTAINYAKSKGLKIFLVTFPPDFANYFSDAEYTATTAKFHQELATRWKGKISVWQIYNEADVINFQTYPKPPLTSLTPEYLSRLKINFDAAKNAIKAVDSSIQITANVTGYPLEQATFDRWAIFFNTISPSLDILSLDIYARSTQDISLIKNAVLSVETQYSKPVIIAETGFPTATAGSSEQLQVQVMTQTLDQLRLALPKAILFYQYSDTIPATNLTESSFGIVKSDGTHKSSYDPIMQSMRNQTGLLRVQTNPAVGITMTVSSLLTNEIVFTKQWGIDWERLPVGNYKITYTNPTNQTVNGQPIVLPGDSLITIYANQTTTVSVDPILGSASISPTPSGVPTPIPVPSGLLRVATNPAAGVTINITSLSTNQTVSTTTWSVDWKSLPTGNYKISYSNPTNFLLTGDVVPRLPQDNYLTIFANQTTTVMADMNAGTQTISPTPIGIPVTPTPIVSTGLLRVETSPATNSTITVFKQIGGTIIFQQPWSIDWKPIDTGSYYITFSNPNNGSTPPSMTSFTINSGRTTEIIANFGNGTTSITYH